MPKYKTHLFAGFITFAFLKQFSRIIQIPPNPFTAHETVILLFFCLFGSLFPDIDTKSKIQKIFYIFFFLAIFVLLINKNWLLLGISSLIAMTPLLVNHRGIFHRLWFITSIAIATGILFANFHNQYQHIVLYSVLFFSAGAFSHIALDYGVIRFIKRKILK